MRGLLLKLIALIVLIGAFFYAARTFGDVKKKLPRIEKKQTQLAEVRELSRQPIPLSQQLADSGRTTPTPLPALITTHLTQGNTSFSPFKVSPVDDFPGWTRQQTTLTFRDVPWNHISAFLAAAETDTDGHLPWRLLTTRLHTTESNLASGTLDLQALQHQGAQP